MKAAVNHLQFVTGSAVLALVLSVGHSGHAQSIVSSAHGVGYTATNGRISARLELAKGTVKGLHVTDPESSQTIVLPELFSTTLKGGTILRSSQMEWRNALISNAPAATPGESAGKRLCADLHSAQEGVDFHWCLVIRSDEGYVRTQLMIHSGAVDLPITEVRLLGFHDPQARVDGTVSGSPIVDGNMFLGFENPLSWSRVEDGDAAAGITRVLPLRAGQTEEYSAVIGASPEGQMRRSFLNYVESERPRPYHPVLDYNSWYDIGFGNRYDEQQVLNRIQAFGTELTSKRHVTVDSFLLDDGWDNPDSFWQFNKGFPDGLTAVSREATKYGSGIGIWLSPWGGYEEKKQRIAYGESHGYEIIHDGYALSGPKYFHDFSQVCRELIDRYGVNQFKLDGTGNANSVFPGSAFDSDFGAAIHLIQMIRGEKKGIFINLTTGTWASPFWLFYADSIWRGGEDHAFAGVGTSRQRWITYRDMQTYRNIVEKGPLFPLNSLMLHGIIFAAQAQGLKTDPGGDFEDEAHACFASGTQLEEMYITPSLLTQADWDILAKYAQWWRHHADTLRDTHWIGGDPGKLDVYGWAAWSRKAWIMTLRNPSDKPQDYEIRLKDALELPSGAASNYSVREPFRSAQQSAARWSATAAVTVHLQPFEVRTFESGTAAQ